MRWRLLDTGCLDGYTNMAVDEAVMTLHGRGTVPPTLRFYSWDPPTMTIGYFQDAAREINIQACSKRGIQVVRRLTGGRAVLHHHELTYSVIAREDHPAVCGTVLASYLRLSRGLLAGLAMLGVTAELARGSHGQTGSAACFDTPARYELLAGGKKLVGSAQARLAGCVLQHGSIPLETDRSLLFECLQTENPALRERLRGSLERRATSLGATLGRTVTYEEAASAMADGFAGAMGLDLTPSTLTPAELSLATELRQKKYATDTWNLHRRRMYSKQDP